MASHCLRMCLLLENGVNGGNSTPSLLLTLSLISNKHTTPTSMSQGFEVSPCFVPSLDLDTLHSGQSAPSVANKEFPPLK